MTQTAETPVVLINIFKCRPEHQQDLIEMVRAMTEAQKPLRGFISGSIHRGLNGRVVANRAVWASSDDWKAMTRHPDVMTAMSPIIAIATFEPHLYEEGEETRA